MTFYCDDGDTKGSANWFSVLLFVGLILLLVGCGALYRSCYGSDAPALAEDARATENSEK